jgi:hypothetical protein
VFLWIEEVERFNPVIERGQLALEGLEMPAACIASFSMPVRRLPVRWKRFRLAGQSGRCGLNQAEQEIANPATRDGGCID